MMRFRKDKAEGSGAAGPPDAATRVAEPAGAPAEGITAPPPPASARVEEPTAVRPPEAGAEPQSPTVAAPVPTPLDAPPPTATTRVDAPPPSSAARVDAPSPAAGARVDAPAPSAGTRVDSPAPSAGARVDAPAPAPGTLAATPPQAGNIVSAANASAAGAKVACPQCGSPADPGQEMCIVCGSRIAPATATATGDGSRGWRLPALVGGLALLLIGTAIAFTIVELTSDDEVKKDDVADLSGDPRPPATTPPPANQPPPTTPTTPTTPNIPPATRETQPQDPPDTPSTTPDAPSGGGSVAEWPAGRTAYTVVLVSATSRNAADAKAEQAIKRGIQAGVLRSDDFSTLRPGYWVVFAGQYDSSEEATRAADRYAEQGFGGGYPRQVKPK